MSDTPETDDLARGNHVVPTEWAQQLERERDEARNSSEAFSALAWKLEGERNEAREKAERYRLEANAIMMQRDEARENMDQEMKFHHRTHSELIETQCKLLDMEMKCDQLQDEIKLLKEILNLIKKDVS